MKLRGERIRKSKKIISIFLLGILVALGIYESRVQRVFQSGNEVVEEKKKVAITFDDGPKAEEGTTGKLLDELKKRDVKATFFVLGVEVERHPELIVRMHEEGHLIGNHSYNHINVYETGHEEAIEDFERLNQQIESIIGEDLEFMRTPYGVEEELLERDLQMINVRWTVDSLDWNTNNVEKIVEKVVTDTSENDIILLHDCYQTSVEAAVRILDILLEKGYEFVTVEELLLQ